MKAFVFLEGYEQTVDRQGTKCWKWTTYKWELPDVTTGAFTRLRARLGEHVKSGVAKPLQVGKEDIEGERLPMIRVKLRQPVMRGIQPKVNTTIKQALRDRK